MYSDSIQHQSRPLRPEATGRPAEERPGQPTQSAHPAATSAPACLGGWFGTQIPKIALHGPEIGLAGGLDRGNPAAGGRGIDRRRDLCTAAPREERQNSSLPVTSRFGPTSHSNSMS